MGDGRFATPFADLKTALEHKKLESGDTIYLRAGTHILRGDTSVIAPNLTIRPYQSEAVVIDIEQADLLLNGSGLILRDVAIRCSVQERTSEQTGSAPTDIAIGGLNVTQSITLTNVRITGSIGPGWWMGSTGTWKGVLIQDSGWDAPDRGHGHAIYIQNQSSNGQKQLLACILINGWGYSLHAYGSSNAELEDIHLTDCIVMNERALIGGLTGASINAVTADNCAFYAPLQLGYASGAQHRAASVTDCLLRGLAITASWEDLTVSGCTVLAGDGDCMTLWVDTPLAGLTIDDNVYISSKTRPFSLDGEGWFTLAEWRTRTGLDATSRHYATVQDAVTANDLTVPVVRVYPVNEGAHIANIAIWNPLEDATVSVNLSSLGMVNGSYELRQVRDYTGDVRAITYTGAAVTVSMSGTTAYPPGYPTAYHPEAVPANALPVFGAFELWSV